MRNVQKLLFIFTLCLALSCMGSAEGLIRVFGYEGRDVKVPCPYNPGYESYEKYLCKDNCDYPDILITTTEKNKTRFFIYDDQSTRIFTTTISNLQSTDARGYWCGVSRNGKDIYTEVKLETRKDSCCNTVNTIQHIEGGSAAITCPYDSESVRKLKYICRGNQPSKCLHQAMITSNSPQKGRFKLVDDGQSRKFKVTISDLNLNDSGSYLCGVQSNSGLDVFSATVLKVKEWCCVKYETVRGTVGLSVTLQCPYQPDQRNNRKFLCKGSERSSCKDMIMGQSRFQVLNVSSHSFWVTINKLEEGDSGTYWCRSDLDWNIGKYTQFHLSVEKEEQDAGKKKNLKEPRQPATLAYPHKSSTVKPINTATPAASNDLIKGLPDVALFSLSAVLPVLLLLLLTIILVHVFKNKCNKVKDTEIIPNCYKLDFADAPDVWGGEDVYQNDDAIVMRAKQGTMKQENASYRFDNVYGNEADYENVTENEDIYCNEEFHKALRK
ncbi:PREDICTED: polymeric immunoglobulin receptor-like isoform X1 [Cyprinodon variegatus]|uniref:Polymeric immunoglobulin receptor-like n=1 Tax=Cyprinodon variegatus TaxID=28743 RepID=A0A3Q2D7C7_CYPVA|nr:PREDICTED: polymeric immunoglobulin receptor-like isoform X1 [Cyprinodon variegatus]